MRTFQQKHLSRKEIKNQPSEYLKNRFTHMKYLYFINIYLSIVIKFVSTDILNKNSP